MKHRLLRLAPLALLLACGGGRAPTPKPAGPPGGGLSAQVAEATRPGPKPGDAVVTQAVFLTAAPPEAAAASETAADAVRAAGLPAVPLSVVPAPVDDGLPLDVAALAAAVNAHADALRAARGVIFVRYQGRPLPDDAQVRAAARAALALAPADAVVVDLSTRVARTPAELAAHLDAAGWRADQITLEATRGADDTVTFATHGMAKFGLPDLEQTGVPPSEARAAFGRFQAVWHDLQAHGHATPGQRVGAITLRACSRPPEAIDHECVAF
ncbi:MAG: hypothetical protein H6704_04300 [Myxococcales bacterium]|nr:hypothetical protein [Myxococcales bacterium]